MAVTVILVAETGIVVCSVDYEPPSQEGYDWHNEPITSPAEYSVEGPSAFCSDDWDPSSADELKMGRGVADSGAAKVLLGLLGAVGLLAIVIFRRPSGPTEPRLLTQTASPSRSGPLTSPASTKSESPDAVRSNAPASRRLAPKVESGIGQPPSFDDPEDQSVQTENSELADALAGIEKLRDSGLLSEEEARRQKIDLLREI